MKSLSKAPCELIEETCDNLCDELWKLASEEDKECRQLASNISSFQETLRDFIIGELYASGIIVEEENIVEVKSNDIEE